MKIYLKTSLILSSILLLSTGCSNTQNNASTEPITEVTSQDTSEKDNLKEDTFFLSLYPFYTTTLPATASSILAVGGYNHLDGSIFIKSGRGPTRLNDVRPVLCAPAVNVSCINENGDIDTITGTSIAAAISTGCSAQMLEWGIVKGNNPAINTVSINGYFISGAKRENNQIYPNNIWGFGKLNILSTFENI